MILLLLKQSNKRGCDSATTAILNERGRSSAIISILHERGCGGEGTLGFVMSGLERREAFSSVVREAKRLGYTEPGGGLGGRQVAGWGES